MAAVRPAERGGSATIEICLNTKRESPGRAGAFDGDAKSYQ
jgi:hypothetical protein